MLKYPQMKMWAHKNKKSGFTIVELLIVIIVIGILAALILVSYSNVTNQAKITTLKGDLTQAAKQLGIDKENGGGSSFPATLAAANNGNGINPSSGSTYVYFPYNSTSPAGYCLQETNGGVTYFVNAASGIATAAASGSCQEGTNLIGWWKLNGNMNDSSGNNNNGTALGSPAPTTDKNGQSNGAYTFNGSSAINLPAIMPTTTAYTKTAWFMTTSTSTSQNIFSGTGACQGHAFFVQNMKLAGGHCGSWSAVSDSTAVSTNVWYFTAMTYDPSVGSGTMTIYKNGTQVSTASSIGLQNGTAAQIGAYTSGSWFNGSIDDVRLYGRALSSAEISAMYTNGPQ